MWWLYFLPWLLVFLVPGTMGILLLLRSTWGGDWSPKYQGLHECPQCGTRISPKHSECPQCGIRVSV